MRNQIFLDEIEDPAGGHALRLALNAFQEHLPTGNHICGCVHKVGGMVWARLRVFVDEQSYEVEWGGSQLSEFAQFIEGNLLPVLGTWNRSLPEFFQSIRLRNGALGLPCRKQNCNVFQQMQKRAVFSK